MQALYAVIIFRGMVRVYIPAIQKFIVPPAVHNFSLVVKQLIINRLLSADRR